MAGKFHHEQIYRGTDVVAKLAACRVVLCGAGAVGSLLADALVRQGCARVRVIDFDRIEEHNVGTQLYGQSEVGLWKVEALRRQLFRATGVEVEAVRKELTGNNARVLLKDADLVVDAFDNSTARAVVQQHARASGAATLHVGLSADYGEVVWDEHYRVPRHVGGDVCDYPLARNLVTLAVAIAAETVVGFVATGERRQWSVTLRDLAVRPLDVS